MILSVSRRTDIPAFYADWFFRRLRAGFVMVRNPRNAHQVSQIALSREVVDGIVFWTKNARPMLVRLSELEGYSYSFQFSLTAYGLALEPRVPPLSELINTFQELSNRIGPERVVWRYDPICLTPERGLEEHKQRFEELASQLAPFTRRCVISILDLYPKTTRNLAGFGVRLPSPEAIQELLQHCSRVAKTLSFSIASCAEATNYDAAGVGHGKCVDRRLLVAGGADFDAVKDPSQRSACGCDSSVDIGTYNTCWHGCRYCYANFSEASVLRARQAYDPDSPLLCDALRPSDEVRVRPPERLRAQTRIFDGI